MKVPCPLCSTSSEVFYEKDVSYFRCETCDAIFQDAESLPSLQAEKQRYELHSDDAGSDGYRRFVQPLTSQIVKDFSSTDNGLDFGAGTSRIISTVLKESAYDIKDYDPYFHNYSELLDEKYDYVSSCEVIEHFYKPYKEFTLLKSLLQPKSKLYIMTSLYDESIDFDSWYYKNDSTHVFFYTKKTFEWIKKEFGFESLVIDKSLVVLANG